MNIKVLLCNCKGLCQSFKDSDFNTLPFQVESEFEVKYAVVHPQLCGQGGNEALADILRESAKEPDTFILCGACSPEAQGKLFQKILRKTGFDPKRFVAADIRGTNNDGILAVIGEKIAALVREYEGTTSREVAAH